MEQKPRADDSGEAQQQPEIIISPPAKGGRSRLQQNMSRFGTANPPCPFIAISAA